MQTQKSTFAAGCFWHVQIAFDQVKGVIKTTVGYTGGNMENPNYEDVCTDETGHAEAVLVEFDPKKVSYENLLVICWKSHDPTQLNRQGPDVGSQYKSVIFYHNEKQKLLATRSKQKEQKKYKKPIVTEILQASNFYPAEEYHQRYLEKRGLATCKI